MPVQNETWDVELIRKRSLVRIQAGPLRKVLQKTIFCRQEGRAGTWFLALFTATRTGPGSFLFGPKDVPHAFTVDSGPARLLFILSPVGMEGLIREMGEPARSLSIPPPPEEPPDEAEMGRLMAIAARYGGEMLGPPPSR
jgi:hypothetical protein